MEIIFLILVWISGLVFGIEYTKNRIRNNMIRVRDQAEENERLQEEMVLPMTFEFQDGVKQVYCYNRDTGDFLGQSEDLDDLFQYIQSRYPQYTLIAEQSELENVENIILSWKSE